MEEEGGYLYASCHDEDPENPPETQLRVYELAGSGTPTSPSFVGNTPDGNLRFAAWRLKAQGDFVYYPDGVAGLKIFDVSNRSTPSLAGTCNLPSSARDVVVDGPYAYVATGDAGLNVINVSDPEQVSDDSVIAWIQPQIHGGALGVAVGQNHVYLAEWIHGLSVIEAAHPSSPEVKGTLPGLTDPLGVEVRGSYAFVADYLGGLKVVDVTVPFAPWLAGEIAFRDIAAIDVTLVGDYALLAATLTVPPYGEWICIVDVSDPSNPQFLGTTETNGISFRISRGGQYLYTSNSITGMYVVDVADPFSPSGLTLRSTTLEVLDTVISGSLGIIVDKTTDLEIVDLAEPDVPFSVATVSIPDASDVSISGRYAYVTVSAESAAPALHVVDLLATR